MTVSKQKINAVAKKCHEANKAYCESIGDDSQPSWKDAPDWQKESAKAGVQFHIDNPNADDSASHDSWLAQKKADGWVYGETKDEDAKTHPCIVPFEELPEEQQFKDALFIETFRAAFGEPKPETDTKPVPKPEPKPKAKAEPTRVYNCKVFKKNPDGSFASMTVRSDAIPEGFYADPEQCD